MSILLLLLVAACAGTATGVYVLVGRNKKLQKKVESIKADLNKTSKILIEKNVELSDQNIRQQKLLESKNDFIAIVSHQLRTPVTEMKWAVQSLLEKKSGFDVEERATLQTVYASIEHLVTLVGEVLKLASLEEGESHLVVVPFAPDGLIQTIVQRTEKSFPEKKLRVELDLHYGETIESIDPEAFTMVLANLVENAFHYTPLGGVVTIQTARDTAGACVVSVADTGIGISPEQQKNIFTKFRRGEQAIVANAHGSGLGLYIVKNMLTRHDGTISFTSQEGKGTTFVCTFPKKIAKI